MASIVTLANEKNGTGSAAVGLNLAICLANLGYRTCLFGTDLTDSGLDIPENRRPTGSLDDVITSGKPVREALVRASGIDIIPSSPALETLAGPPAAKLLQILSGLAHYDFLVLDLAASRVRLSYPLFLASSEVLVIFSPEPASLVEAFGLLKILFFNRYSGAVRAVVDRSGNHQAAKAALTKLRDLAQRHLRINLSPLGAIVYDDPAAAWLQEKKPFVLAAPGSAASKAIQGIARYLVERKATEGKDAEHMAFLSRLAPLLDKPLKVSGEIPPPLKTEDPPAECPSPSAEQKQEAQIQDMTPAVSYIPAEAGENLAPAEIRSILNRLADGVTALSRELKQIRKTLKPMARIPEETEWVPIDFEAYLRSRKADPKKSVE